MLFAITLHNRLYSSMLIQKDKEGYKTKGKWKLKFKTNI